MFGFPFLPGALVCSSNGFNCNDLALLEDKRSAEALWHGASRRLSSCPIQGAGTAQPSSCVLMLFIMHVQLPAAT
jgi:hypothetical protein